MKKFAAFFLSVSLLFACKKEELKVSPPPQNINPTDYILKKVTGNTNQNGETHILEYNSDKLVRKITQCIWGSRSVNGGATWEITYDTTIRTYEYTNGVLTTSYEQKHGVFNYKFTYEYNEHKQMVRMNLLASNNTVEKFYLFHYDATGKMVKKEHCDPSVYFTELYTYDAANNLISHETLSKAGTNQYKYKTVWTSFDDKVNYTRTVNGLPYWRHMSAHSLSINNHLAEQFHSPRNVSDPYGTPNGNTQAAYTYNAAGLPTQMISGPWVVNFEYEKYK